MLGLLTRNESKSILKTASDDADTLSLAHDNNSSVGLPDSESLTTSKLDDREYDFDFEIINTAAYRKAFNKARSKLRPKEGSQAKNPPHSPTSSGTGVPETAKLPSTNAPSAIHSVVASQKNQFYSSRPNALSQDIGSHSVLPEDSAEGAHDGSGAMQEEQYEAGLEHQRPSTPKKSEFPFGEYTVGTTIGTGRKGEIKLAWKKDRSHRVAIKFIRREPTASDTNHPQKILHEFVILRGLLHPNIIRLYDIFETESHFPVVLEYISGGSLAQYVTGRGLSDEISQRLFAQIVSAVGYLHRKGIVHLGLSCSKVLLNPNQHAILTGFSNMKTFDPEDTAINSMFAKAEDLELFAKEYGYDQRDERGFMRGDLMVDRLEDPYYSDPEASLYRLYEGRKADVWSCGVILVSTQHGLILDTNDVKYFMLAGCLPFDVGAFYDPLSRLKHICSVPLIFPQYFPIRAQDLVRRMVVVQPHNRADLGEVARHGWLRKYSHVRYDVAVTPANRKLASFEKHVRRSFMGRPR